MFTNTDSASKNDSSRKEGSPDIDVVADSGTNDGHDVFADSSDNDDNGGVDDISESGYHHDIVAGNIANDSVKDVAVDNNVTSIAEVNKDDDVVVGAESDNDVGAGGTEDIDDRNAGKDGENDVAGGRNNDYDFIANCCLGHNDDVIASKIINKDDSDSNNFDNKGTIIAASSHDENVVASGGNDNHANVNADDDNNDGDVGESTDHNRDEKSKKIELIENRNFFLKARTLNRINKACANKPKK